MGTPVTSLENGVYRGISTEFVPIIGKGFQGRLAVLKIAGSGLGSPLRFTEQSYLRKGGVGVEDIPPLTE